LNTVRARSSAYAATALWLAFLASCSVDQGALDTRRFVCEQPADCGEGWGCVRANPYAVDFCAPRCDASNCDGICIRQRRFESERELCLRGCRIREDGSTSECPGDEFSCVRVSLESDDGVCYPVEGCSAATDCLDGQTCLSELAAPVADSYRTDNLYCVPEPTGTNECPPRSIPVDLGEGEELCLATCEPPDTRCPPGSGCLVPLALASGDVDVPCFPGLYGVPCDDDSNCLLGRCLDVGDAGRQCTVSCDEAARVAGGCGKLFGVGILGPTFSLECDRTAGGGEDGGLCVTRYGTGFPCTSPESDAYRCAGELDCRPFASASGEVRVCTTDCRSDRQCNPLGQPEVNFCLRGGVMDGVCLPKRSADAPCFSDPMCLSGTCEGGRCRSREEPEGEAS
jgi:hypothetical protein